ncbi:hypothetical protein IFM89_002161 [Coptis chinensis]|uniref:F-box protein n=1 Tax=Coptis chinensis TaxID=261450 RepID=A0A835LYU2_9MAGN|nr:hypothetical protein IFM89_002161 [Coptis chinensis]
MDAGWIATLSFCGNLKTLRRISCKKVDPSPRPIEHLGSCLTIETLHLQRCQIRDKESANALFLVCVAIRDIVIQDCWGMHNEMFAFASICRRVKFLSLEGTGIGKKGVKNNPYEYLTLCIGSQCLIYELPDLHY